MIMHRRINTLIVLAMLTGCASSPQKTDLPNINSGNKAIAQYALSLKGTPYRYGKDSPQEGFDCSGFVRHVYQHNGINLPRTAKVMAETLPPTPTSTLQAGDLLFFNIGGKPFSHVGIYLNEGKFIHAPSQRTGKVMVSNLEEGYWQRCYSGARRPLQKQ